MTDIEMASIDRGAVTLHDARRKVRWSVDLEPFEIGVYPVTQEQLAEMIGETASHPRRPATDVSWLRAIRFCNAASEWSSHAGPDRPVRTTARSSRSPGRAPTA